MTAKKAGSGPASDLRRRAEEKAALTKGKRDVLSPEEMRHALHELQVHQIELEMQNEELRRTQDELEAARARYFDLYDLAPAGYFTISEKGLVLEVNLAGASLFGEAKRALIDQPFSHFILPEDQDIYYRHRRQLLKTGEPQGCELRLAGNNGQCVWVKINATLTQDSEGAGITRAIVSNITDRKMSEHRIAHLASFPRLNPNPVLEFDFEGAVLYFNEATQRAIEENGGAVAMFVPPDLAGAVAIVRQGAETYTYYCEIAINDYIYGEDVFISKELHVCRVYARDITDLKRLEFALRKTQEELELRVLERTAELKKANEQLFQEAGEHKKAKEAIEALKEKIRQENVYLRKEVRLLYSHKEIIGNSEAIRTVLKRIEQVAPTGATVLIQGETGTGKELIAHAIHNLSPRKGRLMITVNCAALPPTLIESELFGREKGAYTGALSRQIGRFELADGSTIFLDEVDSLPTDLQAKLLRVLESGEFERLGSSRTTKVDLRIIAASNANLADSVAAGRFREDLYYRLNVFHIQIPPLRDRREDIAPLTWFFVKEFSEKMGKRIESIPVRSMQAVQTYPWPGNIRELKNVIERAMIIAAGPSLQLDMPQTALLSPGQPKKTLQEIEKAYILDVLQSVGWRVSGKAGAAELLGMNPKTLASRMQKLGIKRAGTFPDISGLI